VVEKLFHQWQQWHLPIFLFNLLLHHIPEHDEVLINSDLLLLHAASISIVLIDDRHDWILSEFLVQQEDILDD
jgi:hypothetical protein